MSLNVERDGDRLGLVTEAADTWIRIGAAPVIDIEVEVPRGTTVPDVAVSTGNVGISGVSGPVNVDLRTGAVARARSTDP